MDLQMELAGGQGGCIPMARLFPPLVNAMRDGEPRLAMQRNPLLASSSCQRAPAAREHFPLGAQPYSLSLSIVSALATQGRHPALHRIPTEKATEHPIQAKWAGTLLPNLKLHCSVHFFPRSSSSSI